MFLQTGNLILYGVSLINGKIVIIEKQSVPVEPLNLNICIPGRTAWSSICKNSCLCCMSVQGYRLNKQNEVIQGLQLI